MDYSNFIGRTFGELTVIGQTGDRDRLICKCSCGENKIARLSHLKAGSVKSCGCLLKTVPKMVHGKHLLAHTPTYDAWNSLVLRCMNPKCHAFKDYGARGITVCSTWLGDDGFMNFLRDMGEKPEGMTIDRIDNDSGYTKSNCRWATVITQGNNRRSNRRLTVAGTTMTVTEWSRKMGISKTTIGERLKRGWSDHDAVMSPVRKLRARGSARSDSPTRGQNQARF